MISILCFLDFLLLLLMCVWFAFVPLCFYYISLVLQQRCHVNSIWATYSPSARAVCFVYKVFPVFRKPAGKCAPCLRQPLQLFAEFHHRSQRTDGSKKPKVIAVPKPSNVTINTYTHTNTHILVACEKLTLENGDRRENNNNTSVVADSHTPLHTQCDPTYPRRFCPLCVCRSWGGGWTCPTSVFALWGIQITSSKRLCSEALRSCSRTGWQRLPRLPHVKTSILTPGGALVFFEKYKC